MTLDNIVVAGASLAGLSAVEELRARGFDGRVTWLNKEEHLPYDRPPLSKEILLGKWPARKAQLRQQEHIDALNVDLRFGTSATDLDLAARTLKTDAGERLSFDGLVIATGASPRQLPLARGLPGVLMLRSMDDGIALRAAFAERPRVAIVGFGFIGGEVASAARQSGLSVTVVDRMSYPFSRVLGRKAGRRFAALHSDHGVRFRFDTEVEALLGTDRVEALRLADGTTIPADLVVVGIGAEPCTEWLASSSVETADGVVCNRFCAAAPGVYAAGDVARWQHVGCSRSVRIEHWANAGAQGRAAARNLLAGPKGSKEFKPVPYFWSDQYGLKLQFFGFSDDADQEVLVAGDERCFAALYGKAGKVCGAAVLNWARLSTVCRRMVAERTSWDEALETVECRAA